MQIALMDLGFLWPLGPTAIANDNPMADQNRKRDPSCDFCCLGMYRTPKGILDGPMNRLKSNVGMIYTARGLPLHSQKRRALELIFGGDGE